MWLIHTVIIYALGIGFVFLNALGVHWASLMAKAEKPDYWVTFKVILAGYCAFIACQMIIGSSVILYFGWFGLAIVLARILANKLEIKGKILGRAFSPARSFLNVSSLCTLVLMFVWMHLSLLLYWLYQHLGLS